MLHLNHGKNAGENLVQGCLHYVQKYHQELWLPESVLLNGWERRVIVTIVLFRMTRFCSPFDLLRFSSVTSFWCFSLSNFVLSGEMYVFLNCSCLRSLPDWDRIVPLTTASSKQTSKGLAFESFLMLTCDFVWYHHGVLLHVVAATSMMAQTALLPYTLTNCRTEYR